MVARLVSRNRAARRTGFTLVELLVVILIISILMGLLMVALKGARARASENNCLQNLHQIGMSLKNYLEAYKFMPAAEAFSLGGGPGRTSPANGKGPDVDAELPGSGWSPDVRPINQLLSNDQRLELFLCPTDKGVPGFTESTTFELAGSSYAYVSRGGGWPNMEYGSAGALDNPASLGADIRGVGSDPVNGAKIGIANIESPSRKLVVIEPSFYLPLGPWDITNEQNQRHNLRTINDNTGQLSQQGSVLFLDWSARYEVRKIRPGGWTPAVNPRYPADHASFPDPLHDWW